MTWKNGEYQPKQERADRKKGLILDAALDLFGTRGFHATTAKDVAAKAGVATGTFYRCFVDKKALFMAVVPAYREGDRGATVRKWAANAARRSS